MMVHPTSIKELHLDIQILVFIITDTVPVMLDKKIKFCWNFKTKD